ncbi:hypothetical protein L2E82_28403 [Cichorium intybus]|uniref:Uncharacterized protein n=1 Tax=Cichorium intybus TaxID=13427 RepID=A0ACB9CVM0_CICIN|nr:hypothetical protein L2E82_28403 [Cichorium intybus]
MNHFQASLAAVALTEASWITDVVLPSILHHRRCISRSSSLFLCVRRHQYARVSDSGILPGGRPTVRTRSCLSSDASQFQSRLGKKEMRCNRSSKEMPTGCLLNCLKEMPTTSMCIIDTETIK